MNKKVISFAVATVMLASMPLSLTACTSDSTNNQPVTSISSESIENATPTPDYDTLVIQPYTDLLESQFIAMSDNPEVSVRLEGTYLIGDCILNGYEGEEENPAELTSLVDNMKSGIEELKTSFQEAVLTDLSVSLAVYNNEGNRIGFFEF